MCQELGVAEFFDHAHSNQSEQLSFKLLDLPASLGKHKKNLTSLTS